MLNTQEFWLKPLCLSKTIYNISSPFAIYKDGLTVFPVILDPITSFNVGKTSFRIDDVRECILKGFEVLIKNTLQYEQNQNKMKTENYLYYLLFRRDNNQFK